MFLRKINITLVFVLLALLNAACGKGPVQIIEGRMYRDLSNKFRIDFPEGWQASKAGGSNVAALFIEDSENKEFKPNINIVFQKSGLPPADFAAAVRDNMGNLLGGWQFEGLSELTISNVGAASIEFSFLHTGGRRVKQRQYFVPKGAKMFVITCSAEENEFGGLVGKFEKSVNSFSFL